VPEIGTLRVHDERTTTVVRTGDFEVVVVRLVGTEVGLDETLAGQWEGGGPRCWLARELSPSWQRAHRWRTGAPATVGGSLT
jgi:hypothetical protein